MRRRVSKKSSRRQFRKTAMRVNRKNVAAPMRGGIRM